MILKKKKAVIAAILSAALMLRYTFDLEEEAKAIEYAVEAVLKEGFRTGDIYKEGMTLCTTAEMGDKVAERI